MDPKPPEHEIPQDELSPKDKFRIAGKRVAENPDALAAFNLAANFLQQYDLASMLGLSEPPESDFVTFFVADKLMKDRKQKREVNVRFTHILGEKLPSFIGKPLINDSNKEHTRLSEAERLYAEFLAAAKEVVAEDVGEERAKTIELAIHAILTGGLIKGGKQEDMVHYTESKAKFDEGELEEWSTYWKDRIEKATETE